MYVDYQHTENREIFISETSEAVDRSFRSESKLKKYLNTPQHPTKGTKHLTPVIISESTGLCLKGQAIDQTSRQIKWWCVSGAKPQDRIKWFQSNVVENIKSLGNLSIYVWLGTCNLTTRGKSGFISLTSQSEYTVQFILDKYLDFINITITYTLGSTSILHH